MTDDKVIPFRASKPPAKKKREVNSSEIHCIGFQGVDDNSWYIDDPEDIRLIFQFLQKNNIGLSKG